MALNRVAPLLRIFDEHKAKEFYLDFLEFRLDFEHRHVENAPLYMQISKDSCTLLLSEHYGDGCAGCAIAIETDDLDNYQRLLHDKNYKYAKPGIQKMPWGSRNMQISDPFGNKITFTDAIST